MASADSYIGPLGLRSGVHLEDGCPPAQQEVLHGRAVAREGRNGDDGPPAAGGSEGTRLRPRPRGRELRGQDGDGGEEAPAGPWNRRRRHRRAGDVGEDRRPGGPRPCPRACGVERWGAGYPDLEEIEMRKLFKWVAEWKLVKAIFRTGRATGRAEPPRY